MFKYTRVLALCVFMLFLSGCRSVDIVDGRIPAEYLEQVQMVLGTYSGSFDGRAVTVDISLNGDRLVFAPRRDLISDDCASTVGNLTKVYLDGTEDDYTVEGGRFDFNPNRCVSIMGDSLEIRLRMRDGNLRMNLSILERMDWRRECHVSCTPMNGCRQDCRMIPDNRYMRGRLDRI